MQIEIATLIIETNAKLKALKDKLEAIQNENLKLTDNLVALEKENSRVVKELDEKNEKIKILKLANNMAGDNTDTQGVKRQINELVNEIDRCMTLLNG